MCPDHATTQVRLVFKDRQVRSFVLAKKNERDILQVRPKKRHVVFEILPLAQEQKLQRKRSLESHKDQDTKSKMPKVVY